MNIERLLQTLESASHENARTLQMIRNAGIAYAPIVEQVDRTSRLISRAEYMARFERLTTMLGITQLDDEQKEG